MRMNVAFNVSEAAIQSIGGSVGVTLHRSATHSTLDQALWAAIRNRTHAISFHRFRHFLHRVLQWEEHEKLPEALERRLRDLGAHRLGLTPWHALKIATDMFLLTETGVRICARIPVNWSGMHWETARASARRSRPESWQKG